MWIREPRNLRRVLPSLNVFVFVCWIEKHFRSTQTIAALWDVGYDVPGRNGRHPGEAISFWTGSTPQCHHGGLVSILPANGGHPIPGGDSRFASYPMDDVHQARMTKGVREWGMILDMIKGGIGVSLNVSPGISLDKKKDGTYWISIA